MQPVLAMPTRPAAATRKDLSPVAYFGIFALLSALYLWPCMRVLLPWSNEGTLASGAVRILRGEVFARDFFEVMGPGTFYLLASMFKLLGATFLALRLYVFLVSWGTGLALYALTALWWRQKAVFPCLVVGATSYGLQWPGASHHLDGNFFAMLAVLCIALWARKSRAWLAIAGGALAGVTICIHLPKGVLVLVALLGWLLMRSRNSRAARWAALQVLSGSGAVLMMVGWFFWSHHALGSLYAANVLWPMRHYGSVNQVAYGLGLFSQYWRQWAFQPGWLNWSTGFASFLILPFLYIAALPILLTALLLMRKRQELGALGTLYLTCGAAIWVSEWHRHDIYHLVFGSPLLVVVSLYLMRGMRTHVGTAALQVLGIATGSLLCVNLLSATTVHMVPTRAGPVGLYQDSGLMASLQANTRPGETIFVYPYRPLYYFLTETVNPTRYLTLTYNYNTTSEFQDAIRCLELNRVRMVVWDRKFQTKDVPVIFSAAAQHPPDGFLMEDYLRSHYDLVAEVDGVWLMERREAAKQGRR